MTQKTRIAPLPPKQANLLTRVMYRVARRRFGEVPEPFTVAAHHPRLLIANAVHETLLESGSKKLPASVRELAVFWTARTIGCSWCVDFGSMLQRLDDLFGQFVELERRGALRLADAQRGGARRLRRTGLGHA